MSRKNTIAIYILFSFLVSNPAFSENWWMVEGAKGTCVEAVGNMSWLSPSTMITDYDCEMTAEEHGVTYVDCKSGDFKGRGYAFSKSEAICLTIARMLQNKAMQSQ